MGRRAAGAGSVGLRGVLWASEEKGVGRSPDPAVLLGLLGNRALELPAGPTSPALTALPLAGPGLRLQEPRTGLAQVTGWRLRHEPLK